MGCGKSKHAVVTSTTVVKSLKTDGGKETHTTKTVTDKTDSSLVQQIETTSFVVEDSKKETVTTKIEPPPADNNVVETKNMAPTSVDNDLGATKVAEAPTSVNNDVDPTKVAETEKIKDSSPKDTNEAKNRDVGSKDIIGVTEVVKEDDENYKSNVASQDIVGVTEVVKEDDQKNETNLKDDHGANVGPTKDEKIKASDNEAKTEVAVEAKAMEVAEENVKVTDSKEEEEAKGEISDEKHVKTVDDSLKPKENDLKVEERKDVAPAEESTKVETKKEEDVEVIGADIVNKTETSLAAEPEKATDAKEETVAETKEKEP